MEGSKRFLLADYPSGILQAQTALRRSTLCGQFTGVT